MRWPSCAGQTSRVHLCPMSLCYSGPALSSRPSLGHSAFVSSGIFCPSCPGLKNSIRTAERPSSFSTKFDPEGRVSGVYFSALCLMHIHRELSFWAEKDARFLGQARACTGIEALIMFLNEICLGALCTPFLPDGKNARIKFRLLVIFNLNE